MKKTPLTKAGKPDKRYVKAIKSPSKTTKKAPTKRTVKRRTKNTKKGYYPNPIGKTAIFGVGVTINGVNAFLSKLSPVRFNDDITKAHQTTQAGALNLIEKLEKRYKTTFKAVRIGSKKS